MDSSKARATLECSVCLNLKATNFKDLMNNKWWGSYHPCGVNQLRNSVDQGCSGCTLIACGISRFVGSFNHIDEIHIFPSNSEDNGPLNVLLYMGQGMPSAGRVRLVTAKRIQFYISIPSEPTPWPMIGFGRRRGSCGFSPETAFSTVMEWIQDCSQNHPRCNTRSRFSHGNLPQLPTRVLDLSTSDHSLIRLHNSCGERDRYACLSYCWGNALFLKTTTANLSDHKKGISWSSLTKTFQDAIMVTKMPGIRWLWIDALCIIQDNEHDWIQESGNMSSIYENSFITFAATSSKDGDGGFFYPEMDDEITGITADLKEFRIRVRSDDFFYRGRTRPVDSNIYPLMYRGWCYQERLLARRVLHFGRQEIFWECKTCSTCECQNHAYEQSDLKLYSAYGHQVKDQLDSMLQNQKIELEKRLLQNPESTWHEIVTQYTRLGLTKPSDRLPALSGIAKVMQREREGADYLAGVWRTTVPADLAWFLRSAKPAARPEQWRAPSWTWAAVDGAIQFVRKSRNMVWHGAILEGACVPAGSDPTGQVISAFLKLRGPLCPADLSKSNPEDSSPPYMIKPVTDSTEDPSASPHWEHNFFPDYLLPELEEEGAATVVRVYCLALVTDNEHEFVEPNWFKGNYYTHATYYLVLKCVDNSSETYERIGLGRQEERFPGDLGEYKEREINRMRCETLVLGSSWNVASEETRDFVVTAL